MGKRKLIMLTELENKEKSISVIGLGYVGLPLALEFAKKYRVIGFDINEERVEMMKNKVDPSKELNSDAFENCDILFTTNQEDLRNANFHIVAVPTPVDSHKVPNLGPVLGASKTVGGILKIGDYVVFESTVYPGCTEEDCLPILESESGLKLGDDFKIGYSPERINPGDTEHTLTKILKIVSGSDEEALQIISDVYGSIIKAGIYNANSIKVAEAAKVIENTQRDLNIALMNELSIIFDQMGIDTKSVLDAAGTKWNFLKFTPGLVGGHCIGVDPYYLTYKSKKLGYDPKVILSGRSINDGMPSFVAKKLIQKLLKVGKNPSACKVLVMGITFKENVSDIRNSKVSDLIYALADYSISIDITDPHASAEEVKHEYDLEISSNIGSDYDAVVVAVSHSEYQKLDWNYFKGIMSDNPIVIDLKSQFSLPSREDKIDYWRL